MSLTASARKGTAAVAALAALALGGSAIAGAASTTSSSSDTPAATDTSGSRAHNETALTGAKRKSASDAAIAGATVDRATTEDAAEGTGAAYEVKITKADGTRAEVLEDSSFKVISTKADTGHRGQRRAGGRRAAAGLARRPRDSSLGGR